MMRSVLAIAMAGLLLICLLGLAAGQEGPDVRVEFSSSIKALEEAGIAPVEGVWSLNLNGSMATMALLQSGREIRGQVRAEGGEWEGRAAGTVGPSEMVLSLAYLFNDSIVSALLLGTVNDDSLGGTFIRTYQFGGDKGPFVARRTSNSTEGYAWEGSQADGSMFKPDAVDLSSLWKPTGTPVMASIKQGLVPAEAGPI
ncbi:MAG: hypothetical protein A4E47_01390 [Methanosaeta sp. PtaU1.Bin028]|nr:MAG: hypothetical protein A4E47_01390 [Methanosaeta sp. PtaU1.Bin028]